MKTDATYYHYGRAMAAGHRAYLDFPCEYPPPAMAFLALPAFAASLTTKLSAESYTIFFGLQILIPDWLLCVVLARGAGRCAVLWYLFLTLFDGSLLNTFELLPAALASVAVLLHRQGRLGVAWMTLAMAVACKGYPLVLAPLFLASGLEQLRRLAAYLGLFALTLGLLLAPGLLGGGIQAEQSLAFHAEREPEVETIYANLAMIAHDAFAVPAHVFRGGSLTMREAHSTSIWSALPGWARLPEVVLLSLLLLGYRLSLPRLRDDRRAMPGAAALLTGLFVLGFKVLQTQYMLWLTPLAAIVLAEGSALDHTSWLLGPRCRAAIAVVLFALLGTLVRSQWDSLLAMHPHTVALAVIRNVAWVLSLIWLWHAYCPLSADANRAASPPGAM